MAGRRRVLLVFSKSGYETADFIAAAERLQIDLVAASDRCRQLQDYWPDEILPVRFHTPEKSARELLTQLKSRPPDGVVAIGDRAVVVTSLIAQELGVACNPPEAAAASRDKLDSRRLLLEADCPVPRFEALGPDEDPRSIASRLGYPCVVKPRRLSASRGVIRVDDSQALMQAVSRVRRLLDELDVKRLHDKQSASLLLEQFIDGPEIAVEGILHDGNLQILAIFDKPDPMNGPFFAETIYVTPSSLPARVVENVQNTVKSACGALGLVHGPIHAELRLAGPESTPTILEVAGRSIGGLCSRTLRFGAGLSLEEVILGQAAGLPMERPQRELAASGVMMLPVPKAGLFRGCTGIEAAQAVQGIEGVEITVRPGQRLRALPEGDAYLGFIFARGQRPEQVVAALRAASSAIVVSISPGLPIEGAS